MDDVKVETVELFLDATDFAPAQTSLPTVAEWTEGQMRELLAESTERFVQSVGISKVELEQRQSRVKNFVERLYTAVSSGDSVDMIMVMCDLTNSELREVVSLVAKLLQSRGLRSVAVRVDDFDRIVLFDEDRNKGFAVAPSGSYQRVSRFYDGSFRYGIELLLDQSLRSFIDGIFCEIKRQIA